MAKYRSQKYLDNYLSFPIRQFNQTKILKVKIKDIAAYNDVWRAHWCPYYNDRMEFINPRINEFLQYLRSYKIFVIHLTITPEFSLRYIPQIPLTKKYIQRGNHINLHNFTAFPNESYKEYIPGFEDECNIYPVTKFSPYRDHNFAKQIAISLRDLIVFNFKEAAQTANALNIKYLLITGDHTNMCLMHVMLYCQKLGIIPILIKDLSESAWNYNTQSSTIKTHSLSNSIVNRYVENQIGMTAISYDVLSALEASHLSIQKVGYNINLKYCRFFKKLAGYKNSQTFST